MTEQNYPRPKGGTETAIRAYLQELLENLPPQSGETAFEASAWITFQGVEQFYGAYLRRNNSISPLICAIRGDAPIRIVLRLLSEAGLPAGGFLLSTGSFHDEEFILVYLSPTMTYGNISLTELATLWPPFNTLYLQDIFEAAGIRIQMWPDDDAIMSEVSNLPPNERWFKDLSIQNGLASGPTRSSLFYHIDAATVLRDLNGDDELFGLKTE